MVAVVNEMSNNSQRINSSYLIILAVDDAFDVAKTHTKLIERCIKHQVTFVTATSLEEMGEKLKESVPGKTKGTGKQFVAIIIDA